MRSLAIVLSIFLGMTLQAQAKKASEAQIKESLTQFVPESKFLHKDGHEYKVTTAKQTVVEVEFDRDGTVDEASGDAVEAGDMFVPGRGNYNLAQAVEALKKAGKVPTGDWKYKKSFLNGWVYYFEGTENGKKMDYAVSAKDGALVVDRRDM